MEDEDEAGGVDEAGMEDAGVDDTGTEVLEAGGFDVDDSGTELLGVWLAV